MTRKRTRPDPGTEGRFGPFMVRIRPTKTGAWDELDSHLEDLRRGPDGEAVDALLKLEAEHGEAFYSVALDCIVGRCDPIPNGRTQRTLKEFNKAMRYPKTVGEQRRWERHDLARVLYLFLRFMKNRWGEATGVFRRYHDKHWEDTGGARCVRRCLRAAGYPIPKGDVENFGRRYCYRKTQVDVTLARGRLKIRELEQLGGPLPVHLCLPDLIGMVGKKHSGKVGFIIGGVNKVPADPDALARRLVTDGEEDWSLAAVLCLCLSLPAEARDMARTIPAIGNFPDLVEAWRMTFPAARPFIHKDGGADPVTGTPPPGTPGTPGECAKVSRKKRA